MPEVPQQLTPRPANVGPALKPQAQQGTMSAGLQKLGIALKALEDALPAIPMGSELHTKLLKMTTELSKTMSEHHAEQQSSQSQMQALVQMARQAQQNSPTAALARMYPGGGGGGQGPAMPAGGGGEGAPAAAAA